MRYHDLKRTRNRIIEKDVNLEGKGGARGKILHDNEEAPWSNSLKRGQRRSHSDEGKIEAPDKKCGRGGGKTT